MGPHGLHRRHEALVVELAPVHADALAPPLQVRGGVGADAEPGGAEQDVLRPSAADARLGVFDTSDPDTQTIALQRGPVRATATAYGEPFAYLPEHRPFMAIDGDPNTSWLVGEHGDPVGETLRLVFEQPVELPTFWQQSWDATVIYCPQAQNPGEAHQRRCADRLGARWEVIDTGHYPMLSTPDELARVLAAE